MHPAAAAVGALATTAADPAAGVGVLAAVAAGLVSFLSPCVLPLLPGYLSAAVRAAPTDVELPGVRRAGRGGPVVAGAAFAIAWTPCVGPTPGAILSAAALSNSEAHGALLLGFYSAGLAVPFLFTSLAFTRMTLMFGYIKRHFGAIV